MHDLKYLIHLNTKGRKYVFSANARSDHIMWMQGFSAYFQIKEIYEQFVGRPTNEISRIAHNRSKTVGPSKKETLEERSDSVELHKEALKKPKSFREE